MRLEGRTVVVVSCLALCAGCIPTYQSPRVTPGWNATVDAMAMTGKRVDRYIATQDYMATITPSYGFGRRFELGFPIGGYSNGTYNYPVLMPYAKLALDDPGQPTHIALVGQLPGNLSVIVGHDLEVWEPQVMVSYITSAGGNTDMIDSRYAQNGQSLVAAALGATVNLPEHPGFELGVLRNSYSNGGRQLHYDLFLRLKLGTFGH